MLGKLFRRNKANPYVYSKDTVFVAIEKVAISAEDDVEYLIKYLNGNIDGTSAIDFVYKGIRSFTETEYLITLAEVDRELLEQRLDKCKSIRIV